VTPERLDFATADQRLEGALSAAFQGRYRTVLLFAGDLTIDGDLLPAVGKLTDERFDLIVVTGNLTVGGRIALYESLPGLFVRGTTTAETLEGGDCEIYIGDGTFTYFVYGYYNDGTLETGTVEVPWVINSNHDLRVSSGTAKRVDNYGDDDNCDFTRRRNIGQSFVADVLDDDELDIGKLYTHLKAGKRVLVEGALTATEAALAEVTTARAARSSELDLTEKKLKAFPVEVLRMPWLKKLVLDKNAIGSVPAGIAELAELEELSLVGCGLCELPEELGTLAKLRVLRVGGNIDYQWDDDGNDITTPLKLPSTIGKLASLEVLDVSALSTTVDGQDNEPLPDMTPYSLPEALAQLAKLRVIVANHTNVVFPREMWGMPSIEELRLRGSSWAYLKAYPEGLTSFPNLKRLDLGTNYTRALPELAKLVQLEELDLSNALGLVREPLPDLSALTRLRVLKLSGNTGRTNVPEPGHEILQPLFAIDLPALEELAIDRWGEKTGKGIQRDHVPTALLAGIGRFRALKKLDLDFDGLAALPDDFYTLPALEELSLRYNRLPASERTRLAQTFPRARIDMRNQEVAEPVAETGAATDLVKAANALRDDEDYDAALAKYDEALALLESGAVDSPYNLLYARYGKLWIHGKRRDPRGVAEAETVLRLVPPVWLIFHYTDEGQFHRECVRYASNLLAWELLQSGGDLAKALEHAERGVACADGAAHFYLRDTQVRILLKLGREAEAWPIVQRVLRQDPDFADFQDLKADPRYIAWASA